MEDNKTPKLPEDEALDKMSKKAGKYAAYIYIALAVCIVVVLSISIYSMSFDFGGDYSIGGQSSNTGTSSVPPAEESSRIKPVESENPVNNDVSGITDESEEEPAAKYFHPVSGEIIKGYSMNAPVFSKTMNDYRAHNGVDIKADIGTGVIAFTDGTITAVKEDPLMGMTVEITHSQGLKSVYKNLAPTLAEGIEVGGVIKAGEIIGAIGETAIIEGAEEPHLHFELWADGVVINPQSELSLIN